MINLIFFTDTYWLIDGQSQGSPPIECSTSIMADVEPLNCPTGYECMIQSEENKEEEIPNRGICIEKGNQSKSMQVIYWVRYSPFYSRL